MSCRHLWTLGLGVSSPLVPGAVTQHPDNSITGTRQLHPTQLPHELVGWPSGPPQRGARKPNAPPWR
jgi:hypothetical protein